MFGCKAASITRGTTFKLDLSPEEALVATRILMLNAGMAPGEELLNNLASINRNLVASVSGNRVIRGLGIRIQ